jgi:hypothetical protein
MMEKLRREKEREDELQLERIRQVKMEEER